MEAFERGDYAAAMREWRPLVDGGLPDVNGTQSCLVFGTSRGSNPGNRPEPALTASLLWTFAIALDIIAQCFSGG